jgi:hypothetical protein
MSRNLLLQKLVLYIKKPYNLIVLSLVTSSVLVLAWVGWLTWFDITVWNKDLGAIFFGSRTGEAISLGIGMTVFYYFSIGMLLLAFGGILFLKKSIFNSKPQQTLLIESKQTNLNDHNITTDVKSEEKKSEEKSPAKEENLAAQEERIFSGCLHHFGYLSSRPKDSPIPQECIICQRLGDCMVATVYVKKIDA